MIYEKMSIAELEEECAELYKEEVRANEERKEAVKVLRLKIKQREAGELVEEAKAVIAELSEPSWFDGLKAKLGL